MRTVLESGDSQTTGSEAPNAHPLRRQLGVLDLALAQVLCVVGSSWVGIAAGLGRAQTVMWLTATAVFYLPMAAIVIGLNTAMPLEGGLYVWAHKAFGNLGGFLTAWNLWVYGIAVTATILYAIPTEISYLIGPAAAWLPESHLASFAIVAAILGAITAAALRGLEVAKWIHNAGGLAIQAAYLGLILLPAWGMWKGTIHQGMSFAPVPPPLDLRSMALFGQMLFGAYCGLEYIAIFAGESRQPARNIARSVWIASPVICLMFILGTSSVVAFARPGHIDFIAPIPQTLRIALGNSGAANVVAICAILLLQVRLMSASSYIFTGATRLPMAVGWDALVPEWFTRLNRRRKVPSNSILLAAALVLLLVAMASVGVHAQEAFQILSNASLTHYELTYLAMFGIPMFGALALRRQLPPWVKWAGLVGFCSTLFSLLISAYPFVDVRDPAAYAEKIVGTVVLSNGIAIGYYLLRKRSRTKF